MGVVRARVKNELKRLLSLTLISSFVLLHGCGGGGGGGSASTTEEKKDDPQAINGGGVKGPLAFAIVSAYTFDATQTNLRSATPIATGSTDAGASIVGLALPVPLTPPYILEFTSDASTVDITTGVAPVISTMRTVLTTELLTSGEQVYATPLTTMAVDVAITNADSAIAPYSNTNDGTVTPAEFLASLEVAAAQVVSTLGFGIDSTVDIFDTPPLIDSTTDTTAEQTAVASYRTAVESLTAMAFELGQNSAATPVSADDMFSALTEDLSDGGVIDGSVVGSPIDATVLSDLTTIDPATLPIPNSAANNGGVDIVVADVETVLVSEKTTTGNDTVTTTELEPGGSISVTPTPAETNPSKDGDSIPDSSDNCPNDANESQTDTNGNNVGDACEVAPVTVGDSGTVAEGGTLNGASILTNDIDAEGDTLVPTVIIAPSNASSFTLNADGTFTYIHNGSETTSDSFTYQVTDGSLASNISSVAITVTPVDDPTIVIADTNAITENSIPNTVAGNVLSNDSDPDTALTVSNAAALDGTGTYGVLTISSNGVYSYALNNSHAAVTALNNGDSLTEIYSYTTNGQTTSLTITINGADNGTVLSADTNSINEDGTNPVSGNVLSNDVDPDTVLTVSNAAALTGSGTYGSLSINSSGAYSYTLNNSNATVDALTTGGSLTESYVYQVNGGPTSTLTITINGAEDATITTPDTVSITEDSGVTVSGNLLVNDIDPDTTLVITNPVTDSISSLGSTLTVTASGDFTYTLDDNNATVNALVAGQTLTDLFGYTTNGGVNGLLTITIIGVDDPATLTADTNSINEDDLASVSGNVLTNDVDTDSTLSVSNAAALNGTGTYGTLTIDSTGAYSYAINNANAQVNGLNTGQTLADSYTYNANSQNSTLTITINGADDPTSLTSDTNSITEDGAVSVSGNVLSNDIDPDTTLTVTNAASLNGTGTYGTLTIDSTGLYTYALDNSNPTVDALSTGESLSESYTYNSNGLSTTLVITINGTTDAAAPIDISGVWDLQLTTIPGRAGCNGTAPDGDMLFSIAQSGNNLTIRTQEGALITANIDTVTGAVTNLTGSATIYEADLTDPTNSVLTPLTDTFTGLAITATATTLNGTLETDSDGCFTSSFTGTRYYTRTGTENYSGVYGVEISGQFNGSDGDSFTERESLTFELEFSAGNMTGVTLQTSNNEVATTSNYVYEPQHGYFQFDVNWIAGEDIDGDSVDDFVFNTTTTVTGVFVDDPATNPGANGQPLAVFTATEYTRGDDLSITPGVNDYAENGDYDGYAKLLTTRPTTRTTVAALNTQQVEERILVGLSAVPVKKATPTSKLYIEVLDGGASLCTAPYVNDGVSSGRYFEQINMPQPNFFLEEFSNNNYTSVNCNTNDPATGAPRVFDGFSYTVRVVDTGADGTLGGADDTYPTVFNNYLAEVTPAVEKFTQTQNVFDIDVNGSNVSKTMGGNNLPYYGYFDATDNNVITWPAHPEGATHYQLRVQRSGDITKERYGTTSTSVTLPWYTVDDQDYIDTFFQLVAIKDGSNGARTMSYSRRVAIRHGIWGHWNIELGNIGIPRTRNYRAFHIKLETIPATGTILCAVRTSTSHMRCDSASIDFNTDTVTLNMTDLNGNLTGTIDAPFDLVLNFKPNGVLNNGNAVVTSTAITAIGTDVNVSPAVARSTKPEFRVRSMRMSNGDIQSSAIIYNPTNVSIFDTALFKENNNNNLIVGGVDTTFAGRNFDVSAQMQNFISLPFNDLKAQRNGRFSRYRSDYDWGLGAGLLDAGTYKLVQTSSTDASLKRTYRRSYAALDPSAYIVPQLGNVQIEVPGVGTTNCAPTVACESVTPVNVSSAPSTFNVIWTVPTAPAGSYWRLAFNDASGVGRRSVRTEAQQPDVAGSDITSTDNGDGTTTYKWTNGGLFNVTTSQIWRIQIRVMNNSGFWDVGGFARGVDNPIITGVPPL